MKQGEAVSVHPLGRVAYALPGSVAALAVPLLTFGQLGGVAPGHERGVAWVSLALGGIAIVGALVFTRYRLELHEDGRLTLRRLGSRVVDLNRLQDLTMNPESVQGAAGAYVFTLVDSEGGRLKLASNTPWQRGQEVWSRVRAAALQADLPLSGLAQQVLKQLSA